MHLDTIESFIYPTDARLDCSKNVKIYIKFYMIGAATCFGFSHIVAPLMMVVKKPKHVAAPLM